MRLYRVVVNYAYEMMTFLVERGVLALDPESAIDRMLDHLKIDKSLVLRALSHDKCKLADFDRDAAILDIIGAGSISVKEYFESTT